LPSAFWWALLFGNPDCLVSSSNATQVLHLVSEKLAIPIGEGETTDALRAGQLRKLLRERFGSQEAEKTLVALWRAAPVANGCPSPNLEESNLPPGPLPVGRNQLRWIRDLHDPDRVEREWLLDHGISL
jgi:hypothetical protein